MNILCLGDVVSVYGLEAACKNLYKLRRELSADAVIVNAENASMGNGNGLTGEDARRLLDAGADVLTGGNHSFRQKSLYSLLEDREELLRPANCHGACPGKGYTILPVNGQNLLVVNLIGREHMDLPASCPFETLEKILKEQSGAYDAVIVDFHAEATGEKLALAHYFDGRVQVFFGTHTHVPTADEQVLPKGCGYITDIGMCGPSCSALGLKPEIIARKLITGMPCRFEPAQTPPVLQGALFTLSRDLTRCEKVERICAKV
ncbi:MAG: YmdB family metallophosphoesterase [Clostridia bacterium]|nr:YmdB family metallophosphoesterase [Clostridia bacterium]